MHSASPDITRIRPLRGWVAIDLREIWKYRGLAYFLVWRDLKVRYKQTALGASWAVLQPLMTMAVFSIFFGRLAKMPSDGLPYPLFAFAALVPWTFFANALSQSSQSLVGNAGLLTKVYFPRLLVPFASVFSGIVDLGVALVTLAALMAWYGVAPTAAVIWLPVFVMLALVTALASGLWLSALSVRFRDVRFALPFLIQFWLFATPIAYPASLVSPEWRTLYALNPMVSVVEGFRWALLGTSTRIDAMTAVSTATAAAALVAGVFYFKRMERTFADVI